MGPGQTREGLRGFIVIDLRKLRKPLAAAFLLALALYLAWLAVSMLYPLKYQDLIRKYSAEHGVSPALVCAVIHSESRFEREAVSRKGASGLMQIVRQTADWAADEMGLDGYSYDESIMDAETNINIGCWYMGRLIRQYGDVMTAAAAYNAGSGNVSAWLKDPAYSKDGRTLSRIPFGETRKYAAKIGKSVKIYEVLWKLVR